MRAFVRVYLHAHTNTDNPPSPSTHLTQIVLLDTSASMSDAFALRKHNDQAEATSTLFVAFKRGSPICTAKDTLPAISRLFAEPQNCAANLSNIRPHFSRESPYEFKGSCHAIFVSPAAAAEALRQLLESHKEVVSKAIYAESKGSSTPRPETRFQMAQLALHQFAMRAQDLDLPHALGLMLVGTKVQATCRLTPSLQAFTDITARAQEERAERGGNTELLAGLRDAAQALYAYRDTHQKCKLRILVLTDGEDNSGDDPLKELRFLCTAKITVDVVVLGGAQAGDLAAISFFTGGLVLQPFSELGRNLQKYSITCESILGH